MPRTASDEPPGPPDAAVVLEVGRDTMLPTVRDGLAPVVAVLRDASALATGVDPLTDLAGAAQRARSLAVLRRADTIVVADDAAADVVASVLPRGPWDIDVRASLDAPAGPGRTRRAWRERRVALVTPLPPEPTGVADYSARLASALGERCVLTCVVAGPADAAPDPGRRPVGTSLASVDAFVADAERGRYDEIVYVLGNQPRHGTQLALLRQFPGAVELHDVRVVGAYAGLHAPGPALAGELTRLYPGRYTGGLLGASELDLEPAIAQGVWMVREVAALATTVLVHSAHAAALVADDARISAAMIGPLAVAPATPRARPTADDEPLLVSAGVVHGSKQSDRLVRALAALSETQPKAALALVGPVEDGYRAELNHLAASLGVGDRVVLTGRVDAAEYDSWLRRGAVAVQLRARSNGESSAAVGDCLARGLPTVVTQEGAQAELDPSAVVAVDPAVDATGLAAVLDELLGDAPRRAALHDAALQHAAANTFDVAAERLLTALFGPDPA